MLVQELYIDQNAPAPGGYNAYGGGMDHTARNNGYGSGTSAYDAPIGGGGVSAHMATVPFPTLVNYGVQPETVRQLTEMKMYLWRHVSKHCILFSVWRSLILIFVGFVVISLD